jgi:TolA-binding protein
MMLDDHVAALRELGDGAVDEAETRERVARSLTRGRAGRFTGFVTVLAVLLAASVSWAVATGRIQKVLRSSRAEEPARTEQAPPAPRAIAPSVRAVPATLPAQAPVPAPTPAPASTVRREPAKPIAVTKRSLYQRAHELYFHGRDYEAALAAWDRYLADEPHGQFVVEARYNRALCLVRLGRLDDARQALDPFARGEVSPPGYRRNEAAMLIEKIDRRSPKALNETE